ncbi:uncharacterized oxidoreductase TM_0325-like [Oppia nitens]|uniref:uncharacterized oxidoreductase TM_0325-like n=1 Tax=Oppia nitens TaxID=1686743 RepID=UPI0023D9E374|nr:uncharacterized oxidoreductase TM_0325-like [Oppia nitens]
MEINRNFLGKVVLITGSNRGIGAGIATEFAKRGAQLVITGRKPEPIQTVAKRCSDLSPNGRTALPVVADISREDDCKKLIQTTVDAFNKIDILVNNADYGDYCDPLDPRFVSKLDKLLDVQLRAIVRLTQLSVPYLAKTKGNIVNISMNLRTYSELALHSTAKSAINMFSKCAAAGLASHGIRVNIVVPGVMITKSLLGYGITHEMLKPFADRLPVRRLGKIQDIASAVLYLADSVEARFITGHSLYVEGGENVAHVFVDDYI